MNVPTLVLGVVSVHEVVVEVAVTVVRVIIAVKENNPVDNKKKTYKYESIENIDQKINNAFHDKVIQIGANATIGYGYCTFKNIKEE